MRKIAFVVAVTSLLLTGRSVWAEPYLAAWKGVNCNACHVNQTGGWLRNDFGKNYGNSLQTFDWQGLSDVAQKISHNTPSWVSVGLDIHESYGANLFPNAPGPTPSSLNNFQNERMVFEVGAKVNEVVSGAIALNNNNIREMYGLISLPQGAYLKFGQFTTPYGLELADDNSLVRSQLGFWFDNNPSNGIEAGLYPGVFFVNAAMFNGSVGTDKGFSAKGGFNFSQITIGGSIYGSDLSEVNDKLRYGGFGWGRLGPVVILAEYDQGYDGAVARDDYKAYHASAEVDCGSDVYVRLTSEWFDDSLQVGSLTTPFGYNGTGYDGFRHVISMRCYPVRNTKFQLDISRYDPKDGTTIAQASGDSFYGVMADGFLFF